MTSLEVTEEPITREDVHPEIREKAAEEGVAPTPLNEHAVLVEQADGNRKLVYRTMNKVHVIPDVTEEEALTAAENARLVAELFGRH